MNRYAAKLLFQFRVRVGSSNGKRRLCEERTVLIRAATARGAVARAKRIGKDGEHSYLNGDGNRVYFEFIGIMEMIGLGSECDEGEVWYELKERLLPRERKSYLIPPEGRLNAVRIEAEFGSQVDRTELTQ